MMRRVEQTMESYEITLAIDRDPTDDELGEQFDALDSLGFTGVETSDEGVLMHFEIEAESLSRAIVDAVFGVQRLLPVTVVGTHSEDLVSLRDIAQRTNRTYESVRLLATGKRGPGHFPAPLSTGQWSLYSWAEVSMWFAEHYGAEAIGQYGRIVAAADMLLRVRGLMPKDANRREIAELLTA